MTSMTVTAASEALLAEAFTRHHTALIKHVVDRLGTGDLDLAEDLVGQTWLDITLNHDRVDERVLDVRWLRRCANGIVRRHQHATADDPVVLLFPEFAPEEAAISEEEAASEEFAFEEDVPEDFTFELGMAEAGYDHVLDEAERVAAKATDTKASTLPAPTIRAELPIAA